MWSRKRQFLSSDKIGKIIIMIVHSTSVKYNVKALAQISGYYNIVCIHEFNEYLVCLRNEMQEVQ
jgi:hypothetical protein